MDRIYLIQYNMSEDSVIINRIKALGNWVQYFGKSWIVKSNLTAKDIYEKLCVDYEKESFIIFEINASQYWGRMDTKIWDWLKENK
jgi:hypothetical protein